MASARVRLDRQVSTLSWPSCRAACGQTRTGVERHAEGHSAGCMHVHYVAARRNAEAWPEGKIWTWLSPVMTDPMIGEAGADRSKTKPALVGGLSNVSKGRLIANKSRSKQVQNTQFSARCRYEVRVALTSERTPENLHSSRARTKNFKTCRESGFASLVFRISQV